MNAFERKVVHDRIGELGLRSESEGEEPRRRIVVHPVD
jgi:spoIIIJ-associated protein